MPLNNNAINGLILISYIDIGEGGGGRQGVNYLRPFGASQQQRVEVHRITRRKKHHHLLLIR